MMTTTELLAQIARNMELLDTAARVLIQAANQIERLTRERDAWRELAQSYMPTGEQN